MRQCSGESVADGRYEIGRVVGRGRRSRVHAAYDRVLRRPVACKFLPATDDGPVPRWRAEASALNRFDHAHLVRLLDGGEAGDEAFLVLPLMTRSLASRLGRGTSGPGETAATVLALADALGHVHRAGLAHGAVDAESVLLDPHGRPCWGGLPYPATPAGPDDVERDLQALAVLAVRCVTGDSAARTAPAGVLDVVRAAAEHGRLPGMGRRLVGALDAVVPVPPRYAERVAQVLRRVRRRGRPGFAAVLAAGFAASVLGGIVVDGGAFRSGADAVIVGPGPGSVLAEGVGSDVVSSVQGALDRLDTLSDEPPPVPVETAEPQVARVADDGGTGSRARSAGSRGPAPERAAPQPPAPQPTAPQPRAPEHRDSGRVRGDHAAAGPDARDRHRDGGDHRGGRDGGDCGVVRGLVRDLL